MNVLPTNVLYAVPGMPLCAVCCNTVLANLNARAYLGGGGTANMVDIDLFANSGSSQTGHVRFRYSDQYGHRGLTRYDFHV